MVWYILLTQIIPFMYTLTGLLSFCPVVCVEALDKNLSEEQAGFRKIKSCTDHTATLRIITEQSIDWQSSLYINFTDFEKAFDNVDRDVIWMLMHH